MTSLWFGRYGREDDTLIVTTRGEGSDLASVFRLGVKGTGQILGWRGGGCEAQEDLGVESKAGRQFDIVT